MATTMQHGFARNVQTLLGQLDLCGGRPYDRAHHGDIWVDSPLSSRSTLQPWLWTCGSDCDRKPNCLIYTRDNQGTTYVIR